MGKRTDFGSNWSEFVANWCSGVAPSIPAEQGWGAISVLERLWPEYLDKVLADGAKGIALMVPMIDLGITLGACENLLGFDKVLARMKQGKKGASSEAAFSAALVKLGYNPILEPKLGEKCLDALVSVHGEKVYIEVIAPDLSDAIKSAYSEMRTLADKVMNKSPGMSTDIYLLNSPDTIVVDSIVDHLRTLKPSAEILHELAGTCFLRYATFSPHFSPVEPLPNDVGLPILSCASLKTRSVDRTRVCVHASMTDERAQEMMHGELHHFSTEATNILVMDLSSVPDKLQRWEILIQRRFQPTINRRLGAVVLFKCYIESEEVSWHCSVLENPYAYKAVPKSLLYDLGELNQSEGSRKMPNNERMTSN